MRWPRPISRPVIGVDVSSRWIAAAQADGPHLPRARVRAAVCVARSGTARGARPDAAELARFAEVLDRRGFRGTEVVLAAPDDRLITAAMELPPRSSGAPVVELARMELARTHKLSPEAFEVALWDAVAAATPRAKGGGQYMAAALAHEHGESLVSAFEGAGLRVRAIDARAWALARACAARTGEGAAALLDLGESGTVLVLVQAGAVVYQRTVPEAGVDGLRTGLAASLGLAPEVVEFVLRGGGKGRAELPEGASSLIDAYVETIASEVRAAFEYVLRRTNGGGGGGDLVLAMGAGAMVPGAVSRLGAALGVEASAASPCDLAECPGEIAEVCRDPRLTAAVGLAIHEEGGW